MSLNDKIFNRKDADCECDNSKSSSSLWIEFLKLKTKETGRKYNELLKDKKIKKEYYEMKNKGLTGGSLVFQEPNLLRKKLKTKSKKVKLKKLSKSSPVKTDSKSTFEKQNKLIEEQQKILSGPEEILKKYYQDFNQNIKSNLSEIQKNYYDTYGLVLGNDILTTQQISNIYGTPKNCFEPFMSSLNQTQKDIFLFSPMYTTLPFILATKEELDKRTIHISEPIDMVLDFVKSRVNKPNMMFHNDDIEYLINELEKSDCIMLNLNILEKSKFSLIFKLISYYISLKKNNDIHINIICKGQLGNDFKNFMKNVELDDFFDGLKLISNNEINYDLASKLYNTVQSPNLKGGARGLFKNPGFEPNTGDVLKYFSKKENKDIYAIVTKPNNKEMKHKGYFLSDLKNNNYKERLINTTARDKQWERITNDELENLMQENNNFKNKYNELTEENYDAFPDYTMKTPIGKRYTSSTSLPTSSDIMLEKQELNDEFYKLFNVKSFKNEGACSIGNRYKIIL